jgi:hypothetical protein
MTQENESTVTVELSGVVLDIDDERQEVMIAQIPTELEHVGFCAGQKWTDAGSESGYAFFDALSKGESLGRVGTPLLCVTVGGEQKIATHVIFVASDQQETAFGPREAISGNQQAALNLAELVVASYGADLTNVTRETQNNIQTLISQNKDEAEQFASMVPQETAGAHEYKSETLDAETPEAETRHIGIESPIWLGDRYADAVGERVLPRLQLLEERPSSDQRPFFNSAARSQIEREMVATAERSAKPRSAVSENYHPYRATEF